VQWHGDTVVDVPPRTVAHDGPVYERPMARPARLDALQADVPTSDRLARPSTGDELRAAVLRLVASPNLSSRAWVTDQYDRYVQGNTALAMPDDAGVVRVDEQSGLGVAVSTDCNARFAALDPYAGAQLALAEAYRNVATVGARPLAVSDCLNFGSPEDPEVMWQFAQAVTGLADGCQALGVPVTGGNVSLYNQTGDVAIHPTPVVAVLGVLDDVSRRTPSGWRSAGQAIFLVGATRDELGGSSWADVEHGHLGGLPPSVDLDAERVLGEILVAASRDGLVDAAHDLSDGGLAIALVESCLRYGVGARIWLAELCERDGIDPFLALFSESTARVLVAVPRSEEVRFTDMCTARHVPHQRIGVVDDAPGAQVLDVQGLFSLPLDELRTVHEATLPAAFES
jgi:phosphoribosylformylglycinamidine synthase